MKLQINPLFVQLLISSPLFFFFIKYALAQILLFTFDYEKVSVCKKNKLRKNLNEVTLTQQQL